MRIAPESCFDLAGRATVALSGGDYHPSATDGYWVMLSPLPPGAHRLTFRGFFSGAAEGEVMVQNISYDLHIKAAP